MLRLFAGLANCRWPRRNLAVGGLGPGFDLGHIHIPRNHDGCIRGHIPVAVKVAYVIGRHGVQIVHPAHHRAAIGVGHKDGCRQLLKQHAARVVFGAHAALFLDHLDFLGELGIGPLVVGKAICLQRHHIAQAARRDLLVVAGVVTVGEGVFLPAQGRHTARKLTRRQLLAAFEHHVLQRMGHAGGAIHLLHGPHAQPQHMHRRGRTAVGLHNQLHAVGQRELLHRRGRIGFLRAGPRIQRCGNRARWRRILGCSTQAGHQH